MVAVSKRMRLAAALENATAAAEEFRVESASAFAKDRKTWKRVSRQRERWQKRMNERLEAIDAAIAAMRAVKEKI